MPAVSPSRLRRRPGVLMLAAVALLSAGAAQARPVRDFLAPDGSLDMRAIRDSGYEGTIELVGGEGRIDPHGRMSFPSRATEDPTVDPHWAPLSNKLQGTDGAVYALAVHNGLLYVGGKFIHAGGVQVNNIAAWDGSCWYDLNFGFKRGTYGDAEVRALAVYEGFVYAGGEFTRAGGVAANSIARWDGSQWHALGSGVGFGSVRAMTIFGTSLIVGGYFDSVDGMTANSVAAWDGFTEQWQPVGTDQRYRPFVSALAVYNGRLYMGGNFAIETPPPESPAFHVARWNGTRWVALRQSHCWLHLSHVDSVGFGFGLTSGNGGAGAWCNALCVYGGSLYIGGRFGFAGSELGYSASCIDNIGGPNIIRWNDGANDFQHAGDYASGLWREVRALSVVNGVLVAGWRFDYLPGDVHQSNLATWNGASWSAFGPGADAGIDAILPDYNGQMIVGGEFNHVGGRAATAIGGYDLVTGKWSPLYETGVNDVILAVAPIYIQTLNRVGIVLGGAQSGACDQPEHGISVWDGSRFASMGGGLGGGGRALVALDTTFVVAGSFSSAGTVPANNIASWSPAAGWSALGAGLDGPVNAVTLFAGSIIAGGEFLSSAGAPIGRIARWEAASGTWQSMGVSPGGAAGFDGPVLALAPFQGSLVAAGRFTHADGVAAAGLAMWTGDTWVPLGAGVQGAAGLPGEVHALAVETSAACPSGCAIVIGGQFEMAGGQPAANLARWDGFGWSAMGAGADGPVDALTWYNGTLVAGGRFASVGGVPAPFLARRVAGGAVETWTPLGAGLDGAVNALLAMDNELVVAGAFRHAGGDSIPFVAQWNDSANFTLAVGPRSPVPGGLHLARAGANPFRARTTVRYTLEQPAVVDLGVFDVRGARVSVLRSGLEGSGVHEATWDGTDSQGAAAPVGVYFIRLCAGGRSASTVVVRVR